MGFAEVLTILFVTLKLTHVIDWSWWWVISPELITITFVAIAIAGVTVVGSGVKRWR